MHSGIYMRKNFDFKNGEIFSTNTLVLSGVFILLWVKTMIMLRDRGRDVFRVVGKAGA